MRDRKLLQEQATVVSFLFAFMEKMPVFLDDGSYTRLRFHANQATEKVDEFWREKKRNGVREEQDKERAER